MIDGFSLIQCLAGDWQHDWDDFCSKLWRTADHPGPTCTSLHPAFRPCICACGSACGNSNTIGESVNCERGPAGLRRGNILYDLWGNSYLSMLSAVDASCRILSLMVARVYTLINSPIVPHISYISELGSIGGSGPCITNVIATRRKNFSQWHRSFQRKLRSHWLKFLRHIAITLVIQGPGNGLIVACLAPSHNLNNVNLLSIGP